MKRYIHSSFVIIFTLQLACKSTSRSKSTLANTDASGEALEDTTEKLPDCVGIAFPDRFNIKMENQFLNRRFKIIDNTPNGPFSTLGYFQGARKRLPFVPVFRLFPQVDGQTATSPTAEIKTKGHLKILKWDSKVQVEKCNAQESWEINASFKKNLGKALANNKSKFYRITDSKESTVAEIERLEGPPDFDVDRYAQIGDATFLIFTLASAPDQPALVAYRPFDSFQNKRDTWSFEYKSQEAKAALPPTLAMALPVFLSDKRIGRKLKKSAH